MILYIIIYFIIIIYIQSSKCNNNNVTTRITLNNNFMKIEPKFFLIGAQKAGTTSLYQLLTTNTNICKATTKELHYFDHPQEYRRGISFYERFFTTKCNLNDRISGYIDGTPDYYKRREVPYRMNETFITLKNKKIVFVLREPIAREFSWYEHLIRNCAKYVYIYMQTHPSQIPSNGKVWDNKHIKYLCGENLDKEGNYLSGHCHQVNCLLRAKWISPKNISRNLPTFKEYFENVRIEYSNSQYIKHINNFLKYFDRQQILIINFDKLLRDTRTVLKAIFQHFHVPDTISYYKLPHSNDARVDLVLDCSVHYKMRKYFDDYNKQLYDYLNRNDTGAPSYEPHFDKFTYSKCKDYIPSISDIVMNNNTHDYDNSIYDYDNNNNNNIYNSTDDQYNNITLEF